MHSTRCKNVNCGEKIRFKGYFKDDHRSKTVITKILLFAARNSDNGWNFKNEEKQKISKINKERKRYVSFICKRGRHHRADFHYANKISFRTYQDHLWIFLWTYCTNMTSATNVHTILCTDHWDDNNNNNNALCNMIRFVRSAIIRPFKRFGLSKLSQNWPPLKNVDSSSCMQAIYKRTIKNGNMLNVDGFWESDTFFRIISKFRQCEHPMVWKLWVFAIFVNHCESHK